MIRTSELGPQVVVPHALKATVLHLNHYARLTGHPGRRKVYSTIRKTIHWPALAVVCYATDLRRPVCSRNCITLGKNVSELQVFPTQAPLESVTIDVLSELIRTQRGNQYLLVITDWYTKLINVVPLEGISVVEVAKQFVNRWVCNYGPPKELIVDNNDCFTSDFLQSVCETLNVNSLRHGSLSPPKKRADRKIQQNH